MQIPWQLFLDDIRNPEDIYPGGAPFLPGDGCSWTVARSTEEAKALVLAQGIPELCSFDHDLGGDDTVMVFLNWLVREYWNGDASLIPVFHTHSANPVGRQNIRAFMGSWQASTNP